MRPRLRHTPLLAVSEIDQGSVGAPGVRRLLAVEVAIHVPDPRNKVDGVD